MSGQRKRIMLSALLLALLLFLSACAGTGTENTGQTAWDKSAGDELLLLTEAPEETEAAETPTVTPKATKKAKATATPKATKKAKATATPTVTPKATKKAKATATPTVTPKATKKAKATAAPTATPKATKKAKATAAPTATPAGPIIDPQEIADYLFEHGTLPDNFITKKEAQDLGWEGGDLSRYAPGKSIGGDRFGNYEGLLPQVKGRKYYEADCWYTGGRRNEHRVIYSSDGHVWYTDDHYQTFTELFPSKP